MAEILFDNVSEYFTDDPSVNRVFVAVTETYINDLVKVRGYVYLNQIYEKLGIPWDPKNKNTLFTHSVTLKIKEVAV